MMLRVSSKVDGAPADLTMVTSGESSGDSVIGSAELMALVAATVDPARSNELPAARTSVEETLGSAALVDAAAVIGNFERMTRIADGTGIPLDAPVAALTADLREDLGINGFGSAGYTRKVGWLKRAVFRRLEPLVINRFRRQLSAD